MKHPLNIVPAILPAARKAAAGALLAGCALLAHAGTLDQARQALPDAIKESGTLRVATSLQWAPFDYADADGQATGIDVGLVKLLAQKLGLKAEFTDVKFPSIVPGVATGRFDIGVDQIGITDERLKAVDMIPYFRSGFGLLIKRGAPTLDINKLCGHTLALTQGSSQLQIVERLSAACEAGGQPKIGQTVYPNSADAYMAVGNGREEGFIADQAVAIYIAKQHTNLQATPDSLAGQSLTSGIIVGKQAGAQKAALQAALREAAQDGSYKALLEQYGVAANLYTAQ